MGKVGGAGVDARGGAGVWRAVVDGYAVPSGATRYDYVDVFTNAAFGTMHSLSKKPLFDHAQAVGALRDRLLEALVVRERVVAYRSAVRLTEGEQQAREHRGRHQPARGRRLAGRPRRGLRAAPTRQAGSRDPWARR